MIYTIGHSTLSKEAFLKNLRGVPILIDVRSHPTSRWEQFRKEELEQWLPESNVRYEWWPELGGWDKRHLGLADEMAEHGVDVACYARGKFPKQRIAVSTLPKTESEFRQETLPCCKPEWTNVGLRDYSFFMTLSEFMDGARELLERGEKEDVAICCCEGAWFRCHRSMIADWLVWAGSDCVHLPGKKPHSQSIGNRLERYEEYVISAWNAHAGRHPA